MKPKWTGHVVRASWRGVLTVRTTETRSYDSNLSFVLVRRPDDAVFDAHVSCTMAYDGVLSWECDRRHGCVVSERDRGGRDVLEDGRCRCWCRRTLFVMMARVEDRGLGGYAGRREGRGERQGI